MKANRGIIMDFFKKEFGCDDDKAHTAFDNLSVLLLTKDVLCNSFGLPDLIFLIRKSKKARKLHTYKGYDEWPPQLMKMLPHYLCILKPNERAIVTAKLGYRCERKESVTDMYGLLPISDRHSVQKIYNSGFDKLLTVLQTAYEQQPKRT